MGGAEVAGMIPNSDIAAIATDDAARIVPRQDTAQGVIDKNNQDIESYRLKGVSKVNALEAAFERASTTGITQEFQVLLSDIQNLKAALGTASGELNKSKQYLLGNLKEWIQGNQPFVQGDVDAMSASLDKVNADLSSSIRIVEDAVIAKIQEIEGSAAEQERNTEMHRVRAQQNIDNKVPLKVVNPLPLEGSS